MWNSRSSDCVTVEHLMVEQWIISWWNNRSDVRIVEQRWWNSGTFDGGSIEHLMVVQWNRDGGTVKHLMVDQ